jgi:hypothetical protein
VTVTRQPYLVDGERVPGVTTITGLLNKPALVHWAWKLGTEGKDYRDERAKAADAGSLGHAFAEAYIAKTEPPSLKGFPDEVIRGGQERFEEFQRWLAASAFQPIAAEVALVSTELRFGGRLDAVGTLHGEPALLDLKSRTLFKEQIIQVAAYRYLWNHEHPDLEIRSVHIVGMTDGFHHHQIAEKDLAAGWLCFHSLLQLYHDLRSIKV